MPIFVARQWVRHRAARLNEISARYSVMRDEFYVPAPSEVRRQARDNRQGRDPGDVPPELQARVVEVLKRDQARAYASYEEMLRDDVARELARINLPLSLYTEWYWQMDLHNLFHFLELRMDPHAQWEIRQYAGRIAEITRAVVPLAYEAFERHCLRGRRFSDEEIETIRGLIRGQGNPLTGLKRKEFDDKLFGPPGPPPKPAG
jgi:thymidylate synthase (FAD)